MIQSRQQALIELVNVYEALGGGWPDDADTDDDLAGNMIASDNLE